MNRYLDRHKIEQVILYFIHHANNEMLGTTKLLKLIYFADFDHVELYDLPITGARYQKFQHGPVPIAASDTLDKLAERGDITRQKERGSDYIRTVYTANINVDRATFSDDEWQILGLVRDRFLQWNTAQIVAATHGEAPWVAVRMGEDIPYELAYYRNTYGEMSTATDFYESDVPLPAEEDVFSTVLSKA